MLPGVHSLVRRGSVRKLAAGLVAFVLVFAAAACGDDSGGSSSGTDANLGNFGDCAVTVPKGSLGDVKLTHDGELTVATNLPAPGFWNVGGSDPSDPSSINGGFEYCLAADIATSLGLDKVKVVQVSFDALVAGQTSDFDLALSQVTITDERAKVVDFSTPYFSSDQGVLVNKGTTVANIDDARKLKWGVQASTTGQSYLTDVVKPDSEPSVYQDTPSMFAALTAKQIDAVMLDTSIVLGQAAASNGAQVVVAQFKTGEEYGAIYQKGSPNGAALDKIISGYETDGTMKAIADQWLVPVFKGDPSLIPYITP
jgi:polar amino acid transport system substrate-binding protein